MARKTNTTKKTTNKKAARNTATKKTTTTQKTSQGRASNTRTNNNRTSTADSSTRSTAWNQGSFENLFKDNPFQDTFFKAFPQNNGNFDFDQIKDQMAKLGLLQNYEDAAQASKENVDAAIRSSQVMAKAAEEMGKAIYSFTQSSMELSVQASQAALNVRTLQDLVDVQSEYARNSMDHMISGSSKISDMAVKVANEVMEPINQRMNEAVEKINKVA